MFARRLRWEFVRNVFVPPLLTILMLLSLSRDGQLTCVSNHFFQAPFSVLSAHEKLMIPSGLYAVIKPKTVMCMHTRGGR